MCWHIYLVCFNYIFIVILRVDTDILYVSAIYLFIFILRFSFLWCLMRARERDARRRSPPTQTSPYSTRNTHCKFTHIFYPRWMEKWICNERPIPLCAIVKTWLSQGSRTWSKCDINMTGFRRFFLNLCIVALWTKVVSVSIFNFSTIRSKD